MPWTSKRRKSIPADEDGLYSTKEEHPQFFSGYSMQIKFKAPIDD
jgi:hypothetical protein